MTNALTVTNSRANEIYAKIDNPMQAISELGKLFHQSQIMGINTAGDGAVLALTCMCEGITPLEFARTYHIIKGKPSMRADSMAAKFIAAGGKIKWKNLGDDGKEASATFEFDGQSLEMVYTIEDARKAKGKDEKGKETIDNPSGNWMKDRGSMLRARLITKSVRILAPGIIAGVYIADELEDSGDVNQEVRKEKAEARKTRQKELDAQNSVIVESAEVKVSENTAVADEVIDVVSEQKVDTTESVKDEEPPFETDDSIATGDQLRSLAAAGTAAGYTILQINEAAIALYQVDSVKKMTGAQAEELSARYKLLAHAITLGSKYPSASDKAKNMNREETLNLLCVKCEVDQGWKVPDKRIMNLINAIRKHLGVT